MRFFLDKTTRVAIHGITGRIGQQIACDYAKKGYNLVAGIKAGEGGNWSVDGRIPVFDSISTAMAAISPEAIVIAVAPPDAYQAILESIQANIKLIVCMTGKIPIKDLIRIKSILRTKEIDFLGPYTFGILSPGNISLGKYTWHNVSKGRIGLISRSNQIAFETIFQLTENGYGLSTAIGLGSGLEVGIRLLDVVQIFDQDPDTDQIILIEDEVGDYDEATYNFLTQILSKPMVGYLPEMKNPAQKVSTYAGLKDAENYQNYLTKAEAIRKAGYPLAKNLFGIIEALKNK